MLWKRVKTTVVSLQILRNLETRMAHFTTLVVDDVDEFRRFARSNLEENPECEVVSEASDGLQAVLQAQELQPDLILLDIGLPTLNGIDAARRIHKLSPKSKILFFTQNCDHEIAQRALRTGARGYLLKSDGTELPSAIETVLRGEQFVSSRIKQISTTSHKPDDSVFTKPS